MKRLRNLWEYIVAFDNLYLAYKKACRGKKSRDEVAWFGVHLEKELFSLQDELVNKSYFPGRYRVFTIYERKPRQISAAPFRDRVVHHALMNVVEPLLDKHFIFDSYACRREKGVHKAVERYQQWANRYAYVLKFDIASYFPSIDHQILYKQLSRRIKDPNVLWLFEVIINNSPVFQRDWPVYFRGDDMLSPIKRRIGMPIGNLTSQFLANLYLDDFDHFVKEQLQCKGYLRYVDDAVLLADSKDTLWQWNGMLKEALGDIRLLMHPRKVAISPVSKGIDLLGYRVFPKYALLRNDNGHRFIRRFRRYAAGYQDGSLIWDDFNQSVQSWIGHASQSQTEGLRESIFNSTVLSRGEGGMCAARRFLEQQN